MHFVPVAALGHWYFTVVCHAPPERQEAREGAGVESAGTPHQELALG